MGKNGVGGTVGGTTGWTIRASIDPFKGKNQGKKREKRAETYPLIPFNAGEKAPQKIGANSMIFSRLNAFNGDLMCRKQLFRAFFVISGVVWVPI